MLCARFIDCGQTLPRIGSTIFLRNELSSDEELTDHEQQAADELQAGAYITSEMQRRQTQKVPFTLVIGRQEAIAAMETVVVAAMHVEGMT